MISRFTFISGYNKPKALPFLNSDMKLSGFLQIKSIKSALSRREFGLHPSLCYNPCKLSQLSLSSVSLKHILKGFHLVHIEVFSHTLLGFNITLM